MLVGDGASLLVDVADLHDHLQVRSALQQHHQLDRLSWGADARLHAGLLQDELNRVRAQSVIDGAQSEIVGVAALLSQHPLQAVHAINPKDLVLHGTPKNAIRRPSQVPNRDGAGQNRNPGFSPKSHYTYTKHSLEPFHLRPIRNAMKGNNTLGLYP